MRWFQEFDKFVSDGKKSVEKYKFRMWIINDLAHLSRQVIWESYLFTFRRPIALYSVFGKVILGKVNRYCWALIYYKECLSLLMQYPKHVCVVILWFIKCSGREVVYLNMKLSKKSINGPGLCGRLKSRNTNSLLLNLFFTIMFRGESDIDFLTQCVKMIQIVQLPHHSVLYAPFPDFRENP